MEQRCQLLEGQLEAEAAGRRQAELDRRQAEQRCLLLEGQLDRRQAELDRRQAEQRCLLLEELDRRQAELDRRQAGPARPSPTAESHLRPAGTWSGRLRPRSKSPSGTATPVLRPPRTASPAHSVCILCM